ncbi:hypothetical protein J6590_070347 [Homalodisca vitripennis]|nr:hypothetical protein J6590_070347 [Homalodisca vitripennis]
MIMPQSEVRSRNFNTVSVVVLLTVAYIECTTIGGWGRENHIQSARIIEYPQCLISVRSRTPLRAWSTFPPPMRHENIVSKIQSRGLHYVHGRHSPPMRHENIVSKIQSIDSQCHSQRYGAGTSTLSLS